MHSTNRRVAMPIGCTTIIVDFLAQAILLSRSRVGQVAHALPSQFAPADAMPPTYYHCYLCQWRFNSAGQLRDHVGGANHRRVVIQTLGNATFMQPIDSESEPGPILLIGARTVQWVCAWRGSTEFYEWECLHCGHRDCRWQGMIRHFRASPACDVRGTRV